MWTYWIPLHERDCSSGGTVNVWTRQRTRAVVRLPDTSPQSRLDVAQAKPERGGVHMSLVRFPFWALQSSRPNALGGELPTILQRARSNPPCALAERATGFPHRSDRRGGRLQTRVCFLSAGGERRNKRASLTTGGYGIVSIPPFPRPPTPSDRIVGRQLQATGKVPVWRQKTHN